MCEWLRYNQCCNYDQPASVTLCLNCKLLAVVCLKDGGLCCRALGVTDVDAEGSEWYYHKIDRIMEEVAENIVEDGCWNTWNNDQGEESP